MDRSQAFHQLNSLTLQCHSCRINQPPTHILISAENTSKPSYQCRSHQNRSQQTKKQELFQSNQQDDTCIQKDTKPQQSLLPLFCFTCFTKKQAVPTSRLHFQTYHQAGKRFISKIQSTENVIVQQCLKTVGLIEDQANAICKQISQAIDRFKFYILKLSADVRKMCKTYEDNLAFFKHLKVQEILLEEIRDNDEKNVDDEGARKMFHMNQAENIIKLTRKLEELKSISKKIPEIKLSMPTFNQEETRPKRKRAKALDLPISSLITLRGQNYFGTADGRIIYTHLTELLFHQAHDSLIRSFSHDDQYTLYSGSDDFSIKAWNTRNGKIQCLKVFGMIADSKSYHRNISVIEQGKLMVSTRGQFDNFRLRIWSLQGSYRNIGVLEGHSSFIRAMVVVDKQKNTIMTCSDDRTIKLWNPEQSYPIRTIFRRKIPQNIIVNSQLQLCCIMEQDNRVSIVDLIDFTPVTSMTMGRRILCSCGYSKGGSSLREQCNDYLAICIPGNVGIWTWDCIKLWSFDLETGYTPTNLMQVFDSIIASDGFGMIDEFYVGELPSKPAVLEGIPI